VDLRDREGKEMDVGAAQNDMRRGYVSGGPGILASSLAWFAAAYAAWSVSPEQSVWVLFAGGVLIHPIGVLICKSLGASGSFSKGNPFGSLAFATTLWLIFSLPLTYVVALQRIEWFFPAMLLVIGGRYLTFGTLFGMRVYWALGLALAGAGVWLGRLSTAPAVVALAGASIEFSFALVVLGLHARWARANANGAAAPMSV
jgi:Family of unknown function (DUF7010)